MSLCLGNSVIDAETHTHLHKHYLQWLQLATWGQCGLHSLCLGQVASVDASVCGLGGLSQALYLYFIEVYVCVCFRRCV